MKKSTIEALKGMRLLIIYLIASIVGVCLILTIMRFLCCLPFGVVAVLLMVALWWIGRL